MTAIRPLLLLALFAVACRPAPAPEVAPLEGGANRDGYRFLTARLAEGEVHLLLPERLRSGDRISGRVLVDHANEQGQWSNSAKPGHPMAEWTVAVGEHRSSFVEGLSGVRVEPTTGSGPMSLSLELRDAAGRLRAAGRIPLATRPEEAAAPVAEPWCASFGTVRLRGSFDGVSETTRVTIGGEPLSVWTESPRALLATTDGRLPLGRQELVVTDGEWEHRAPIQVLAVEVTPRQARVEVGERVDYSVRVDGLAGLGPEHEPSLELGLWMDEGHWNVTDRIRLSPEEAVDGSVVLRRSIEAPATGTLRLHGRLDVPPT